MSAGGKERSLEVMDFLMKYDCGSLLGSLDSPASRSILESIVASQDRSQFNGTSLDPSGFEYQLREFEARNRMSEREGLSPPAGSRLRPWAPLSPSLRVPFVPARSYLSADPLPLRGLRTHPPKPRQAVRAPEEDLRRRLLFSDTPSKASALVLPGPSESPRSCASAVDLEMLTTHKNLVDMVLASPSKRPTGHLM